MKQFTIIVGNKGLPKAETFSNKEGGRDENIEEVFDKENSGEVGKTRRKGIGKRVREVIH